MWVYIHSVKALEEEEEARRHVDPFYIEQGEKEKEEIYLFFFLSLNLSLFRFTSLSLSLFFLFFACELTIESTSREREEEKQKESCRGQSGEAERKKFWRHVDVYIHPKRRKEEKKVDFPTHALAIIEERFQQDRDYASSSSSSCRLQRDAHV